MDFYYEFLELNPNPIFIVKPIINKDKCTDFIYEYVNNSFELFLQLDKEELVGKNYTSIFKTSEDSFYDAFYRTVINKEVVVLEDNSPTINKKKKFNVFQLMIKYARV